MQLGSTGTEFAISAFVIIIIIIVIGAMKGAGASRDIGVVTCGRCGHVGKLKTNVKWTPMTAARADLVCSRCGGGAWSK